MDDLSSDRVREVLARLEDFLDRDVAGIARDLERRQARRSALEADGTLSPARNLRIPAGTDEIQKNAIAAGLLGRPPK